jgi:hypothetical protein
VTGSGGSPIDVCYQMSAPGYGGCPTMWTARMTPDDCCDVDGDAHPGQTAFFTTPIDLLGCLVGLPYDYNCDGAETLQYSNGFMGPCLGEDEPACLASATTGWTIASGIPPCGGSGGLRSCVWGFPRMCSAMSTTTTQGCR